MEEKDYILFESYLSEELSEDEKATFELRLAEESSFKEAFYTYKELSTFLENKFENEADEKAFEANLKNISEKHFSNNEANNKETSKPKVFNFYKYAIAASVALLIGFFTFQQFNTASYSDFAEHEIISLTVRGEQDELLKIAETAFNAKDFEKAEITLSKLLEANKSNIEIKLYKAITLIELDRFNEADGLLEDIVKTPSAYKNKAIWYKALSKLKQKDYDACLRILKTIPEDADDYNKAQQLIKKLD